MLNNNSVKEISERSVEGEKFGGSLMSIEDIAAVADGMLYCNRRQQDADPAQLARIELHHATLVHVAGELNDAVWDHVRQLSEMLTAMPAVNIDEVRAKIRLWRSLAPESTFDLDEQTPDEALLCSIIADIERIAA